MVVFDVSLMRGAFEGSADADDARARGSAARIWLAVGRPIGHDRARIDVAGRPRQQSLTPGTLEVAFECGVAVSATGDFQRHAHNGRAPRGPGAVKIEHVRGCSSTPATDTDPNRLRRDRAPPLIRLAAGGPQPAAGDGHIAPLISPCSKARVASARSWWRGRFRIVPAPERTVRRDQLRRDRRDTARSRVVRNRRRPRPGCAAADGKFEPAEEAARCSWTMSASLSLSAQAKLPRDSGDDVERVGGDRRPSRRHQDHRRDESQPVGARARRRLFPSDLFYRLSGVEIVPTLANGVTDILELADYFLNEHISGGPSGCRPARPTPSATTGPAMCANWNG